MAENYLFTSESVSEGHPDKVADQISDAVIDTIFRQDPKARIACETMINTGMIVLSGEITTSAGIDYQATARNVVREIGYTCSSEMGFDADSCAVLLALDRQSADIARGVNEGEGLDLNQGAGDQGLMFGFACDETDVLMPFPITYAHRLVKQQAAVRKSGRLGWLRPDAKSQVSVIYENGRPAAIDTVVLSTQHGPDIAHHDIEQAVIEEIIKPVLPEAMVTGQTRYLVNPTGRFVVGGPAGDCGLTGRKIIVDTYGGMARHGGGAFSGKDPSKVDRSAAYAARYVAKNIVAAGLAKRCEIQISYAIGMAEPISFDLETFGTARVAHDRLIAAIRKVFDLRPKGIIQMLDLLRPIYRQTAAYGHFGRGDIDLPWEKTDRAEALEAALT